MRRDLSGSGIAVGVALSLACGDGGSSPSPNQFAGTWDGTKLEFTKVGSPSTKVDVVAAGGTLVVVLHEGGTYQMTLTLPGGAPEVTSGTWSASADVFTMQETGVSWEMQFDWHLAGSTLTLSGADGDFDFDGDDILEAAKVGAVLVRR